MWLYLALVAVAWALGWLVRDRRTLPTVTDKHVFITGCDSGFGNLLARRLARRGYRVLAACLTPQGAESLRGDSAGGHLRTTLLDVTRSDSIRRAAEWVQKEVGEKGRDPMAIHRRDMRHFGVKVSVVEPGFFKTNVTDLGSLEAALRQRWERLEPGTRSSYGEHFL
ncbi:RDH7 dehydrogenase, partial [Anthoscopus minutus]|nr:RDH7 dehydrogenase [Anthoscopus minutus]